MQDAHGAQDPHLQTLLTYLEQDPGNGALLNEIADLALSVGDIAHARLALDRLFAKTPDDPVLSYRMSVLLFLERRFEDSLLLTNWLVDSGPAHPAVLCQHAMTLFELKRFGQAAAVLALLDNDQDRFPELPSLTIRALHCNGDLGKATALAEAHLASHGGDAVVKGMLSLLCLDQDDIERAGALAAQTLAVAPANLDALLAAGSAAIGAGDVELARSLLGEAAIISPGNGRATLGLGMLALRENNLALARQELEKTVLAMPEHPGSWNTLAWIQILGHDLDAAQATLEQARSIDRNFGETHGGLAVVAAMRGDLAQARQLADMALRLQADSISARYAKSLIMAGHGRLGQAQLMLDAILNAVPASGGATLKALVERCSRARPLLR